MIERYAEKKLVEALQYTGWNSKDFGFWFDENMLSEGEGVRDVDYYNSPQEKCLIIGTEFLELFVGDWLVVDSYTGFNVYTDEEFQSRFRKVKND